MRRTARMRIMTAGVLVLLSTAASAGTPFTAFESGQVRPLALSPDGSQLFAVNTPDDRPGQEAPPTAAAANQLAT